MAESYPKFRTDLIVTTESDGDQVVYTIKEPLTGRFFRLRAPEYYLLSRADGRTSPDEAARLTEERFGIHISVTAVRNFYAKMERHLFFEGPALERERPRLSRRAIIGQQRSIGTMRLKAFDPDPMLARWIPRLRFLFTPAGILISLGILAVATAVAVSQYSVWSRAVHDLWHLSTIPLLVAGILVVGFVHEFGHALTLKYFGGSVREMGFLLLYFQPCFYCNLSDAYLLNSRRAKILVGLAGLFFQAVLTAVFVLLWRIVAPGTVLSGFFQVAVAFSLAVFLFNFNPLIRLDGYYMLADWLRIPNLRSKAFAHWRSRIAEWTVGRPPKGQPLSRRHRLIFDSYGILASAYTAVLLGWVLIYVTRFVHGHWGFAGNGIVYGSILFFAMNTAKDGAAGAATDTDRTEEPHSKGRNWRKPILLWGGLALAIIVGAFVDVERHAGSVCRVEPSSRFTVTSSISGTLETELFEGRPAQRRERSILLAVSADFSAVNYKILVAEGDTIPTGDTVLVLTSNLLIANLRQKESEREQTIAERNLLLSGPKRDQIMGLRAEIAEIEAQRENKRLEMDRAEKLLARKLIAQDKFEIIQTELKVIEAQHSAKSSQMALLISAPKAEELAIKEAQLSGLDATIAFLQSQIDASTVIAPIGGIVTQVSRGNVLLEIAELDPVRVELAVEERDIADVGIGDPVELKVQALPFERFCGHVLKVAVDADTVGGEPRFAVITEVENPGLLLKSGMTGYAKVSCGKRSLLHIIFRRMIHFVRVEFWSWW